MSNTDDGEGSTMDRKYYQILMETIQGLKNVLPERDHLRRQMLEGIEARAMTAISLNQGFNEVMYYLAKNGSELLLDALEEWSLDVSHITANVESIHFYQGLAYYLNICSIWDRVHPDLVITMRNAAHDESVEMARLLLKTLQNVMNSSTADNGLLQEEQWPVFKALESSGLSDDVDTKVASSVARELRLLNTQGILYPSGGESLGVLTLDGDAVFRLIGYRRVLMYDNLDGVQHLAEKCKVTDRRIVQGRSIQYTVQSGDVIVARFNRAISPESILLSAKRVGADSEFLILDFTDGAGDFNNQAVEGVSHALGRTTQVDVSGARLARLSTLTFVTGISIRDKRAFIDKFNSTDYTTGDLSGHNIAVLTAAVTCGKRWTALPVVALISRLMSDRSTWNILTPPAAPEIEMGEGESWLTQNTFARLAGTKHANDLWSEERLASESEEVLQNASQEVNRKSRYIGVTDGYLVIRTKFAWDVLLAFAATAVLVAVASGHRIDSTASWATYFQAAPSVTVGITTLYVLGKYGTWSLDEMVRRRRTCKTGAVLGNHMRRLEKVATLVDAYYQGTVTQCLAATGSCAFGNPADMLGKLILQNGIEANDLARLGWRFYDTAIGKVYCSGSEWKTLQHGGHGFEWHAEVSTSRMLSGTAIAMRSVKGSIGTRPLHHEMV